MKTAKYLLLLLVVLKWNDASAQQADNYKASISAWETARDGYRKAGCTEAEKCANLNIQYLDCQLNSLRTGAPACMMSRPSPDCKCDGTANGQGNTAGGGNNTGVNSGAATAGGSAFSKGLSETSKAVGNRDNDITKTADQDAVLSTLLGDGKSAQFFKDVGNTAAIINGVLPPPLTPEEQAKADAEKKHQQEIRAKVKEERHNEKEELHLEKDFEQIERKAKRGVPAAEADLGYVYEVGALGQSTNHELAKKWYSKAAEDNNPRGLQWLIGNYEHGWYDYPMDFDKAEATLDRLVLTDDCFYMFSAIDKYFDYYIYGHTTINDACQKISNCLQKIVIGKHTKLEKDAASRVYNKYFRNGDCTDVNISSSSSESDHSIAQNDKLPKKHPTNSSKTVETLVSAQTITDAMGANSLAANVNTPVSNKSDQSVVQQKDNVADNPAVNSSKTTSEKPAAATTAKSDDMEGPALIGGVVAPPPPPVIYSYVEQMPSPDFDLKDYLQKNLHYPQTARDKNVEGKAIVKFVVNEDGSISNATIVHGPGAGCDEEAIRVVSQMPRWKPGTQNGKPVKVYYTMPIQFALTDR